MSLKKILYIFLGQVLALNILNAQFSKQGYALVSRKLYDSTKRQYFPMVNEAQIWYKDSMAIRPQYRIFDSMMNHAQVLQRVDTKNYFFISLKNKNFYEYDSFNTKNNFYKSYTLNDSMKQESSFGYLFFSSTDSNKKIRMPDEKYSILRDTLIDGIKFKRLKCIHIVNYEGVYKPITWIAYFRYDIRKSIMHLAKDFDEKMGWPMVMLEVFEPQLRTRFEIKYVRSALTKQELAVFNAWERNARLNPVPPSKKP